MRASNFNMTYLSRLYFEAHITVEAKDGCFDLFMAICKVVGWKGSRFDQDEVDAYHGMWFMSQRNKSYSTILDDIRSTIPTLEENGFTVIRWKVEDTVLDSKHGDTLD
jgi:hypothetical protein